MRTLPVLFILLLLTACTDRPKMIPEKEMKVILRESILTDAWLSTMPNRDMSAEDTISYFSPILEKYGYTIGDLKYSLGKYSKRKTDVLSAMNLQLQEEFEVLRKAAERIVNTEAEWDKRATQKLTDTLVVRDSTLRLNKLRDSSLFDFEIPLQGGGTYKIEFEYLTDSIDKNLRYRLLYQYEDFTGRKRDVRDWSNINVRGRKTRFSSTQEIKENDGTTALSVRLRPANSRKFELPNITIDSLRVTYLPPIEKARALYFMDITHIKPFHTIADELIQKDSLALRPAVRPPYKE